MIRVEVSENYAAMSEKAAGFIVGSLRKKPEALACFPAGDTPAGVFRQLVRLAQEGAADFSRSLFVGLDEWVGLGREDAGSCQHFLYTHFFEPLRIGENRICFFDACAAELEAECRKADGFIREHGLIDLMVLGIGLNGHVGFNEPGADTNRGAYVTPLHPVTRMVGQKYFGREFCLDQGITLGMKHILEARSVVLLAGGESKADIVQKAIEGPPTNLVPASLLQRHEYCVLFADRAAASKLKQPVS
jgi:glucosamine-6-phosphate isomerase